MGKRELFRRYLFFIVGLFVNSLGISMIIKADLGSSPISSLPYTFSLLYPVSLGTLTFFLNLILIAGQWIIAGKNFKAKELLQLPVSVLFGAFIDASMVMLEWVEPGSYAARLAVLAVGCAVLGLGVSMEVIADVVMLSGEAFVRSVCLRWKKEFGVVKICFDSSLMILSVAASLAFAHRILGVREGTVVAAFAVGMCARYFNGKLAFMGRFLTVPEAGNASVSGSVAAGSIDDAACGNEAGFVPDTEGLQVCHVHERFPVITLAREYGSGGHRIGAMVAEKLGIPFYDRELVELAAEESGMDLPSVNLKDQNIPSNMLYDLILHDYTEPLECSLSKDDALFVAQSRIIRKLAEKGPCVIVGRCADYVLRDFSNVFNVFVHSPVEDRIKRVVGEYGISPEDAEQEVRQVDRGRANHYRTYTGREWRDPLHYDLCLDSSTLGVENCAAMIAEAAGRACGRNS